MRFLVFIFFSSICLSACGGGGGGGSAPVTMASSTAALSSVALSSSVQSVAVSSIVASSVAPSSSSATNSSSTTSSSTTGITATVTPFIVVDQFGYLPNVKKIAVIRNPQTGYDSANHFTPSANLSLVDMSNGQTVLTAAPSAWNSGNTDNSSGDKAWWFDFSSVTTAGTYAVVDKTQNLRSPSFKIASNVYKPVLKSAMRMFFYQRAGFAKQLPYAEAGWVDAASHLGPGQDKNARLYNDKNNAATERDLSGAWFDAGDYNKYTSWTASYVITLLHAYIENPAAWTDDFNIPESGNGIPDVLDEVKWGLDWLKKMQDATGNNSVLSIVSLSSDTGTPGVSASPPSTATGASYYGPATTNATMETAAAFAFASKVFTDLNNPNLNSYAADLKTRAENAWTWAVANPSITFYNNDNTKQAGTAGVGAGQQEVDDAGRAQTKRQAAIYLFDATGKTTYRDFIDADYLNAPLIKSSYADAYHEFENTSLIYYTTVKNATASVSNAIKNGYNNAMNGSDNWQAMRNNLDPYRAYLQTSQYTWGSNSTKSLKGIMFVNLTTFNFSGANSTETTDAGLTYINYMHGVNPQGMVYLSNMYSLGAYSSVNEFFHTWFADGSAKWDRVGVSQFGPPPGYLVGGANKYYDWDSNCTSASPNSGCGLAAPSPPKGQPAQKSYKDFNTSWPLDSWSISEPSCGYQANYLRLLSKFVN